MISRTGILVATVFSVLAIGGLAASSASANWFVNGTELGKGSKQALTTTAKVDEDAKLVIHANPKLVILCKGTELEGTSPEIIGQNEAAASSLTFEGCEVTEPKSVLCDLEPAVQNISTTAVKAVVTKSTGTSDLVTFTPKTKTVFVNINFNIENKCAMNSLEPITGAVTVNAPTGQTESTLQALEGLGSVDNNSLQVAGNKALIEGGKALLRLTTGSKWSFH